MSLKYVILNGCFPIVFSEAQKHVDFASLGKIDSAGFCSFQEVATPEERTDICTTRMKKVSVWGESRSLKLKSKAHDAELIEKMLNNS